MQTRPKQELQRRSFYAAHVPKTLSEFVVRAAECEQGHKEELDLLKGMLAELLSAVKDQERPLQKEEQDRAIVFMREIRATQKAFDEAKANEKGLVHPAKVAILAQNLIQIMVPHFTDDSREDAKQELTAFVAQFPVGGNG